MRQVNRQLARAWLRVTPRLLPFADVATADLPIARLLRLALFQVSVGMAVVLLNGTLNRVMIVELGVPAWLVAVMIALPLVVAPFRALIGFRSDHHRSALGWRRVPFIWIGTLLQFGGLAIMPFALLVLSGDTHGPVLYGQIGAALAFLLVGAGLHTTQTAGLALATDLAPEAARPRVVALLYVMLLLGMLGSALIFGALLADFSQLALIKVVQGAAVITMVLNIAALWKQEARDPVRTAAGSGVDGERPSFMDSWRAFDRGGRSRRLLVAVGLGTAGFSMQDILLEPYGGQILNLSVGATTTLTAILSAGTLAAFILAARRLARGIDPHRLAASGALTGIAAFSAVILSALVDSPLLFRLGTGLIGFGAGLFAVGTLIAVMALARGTATGNAGSQTRNGIAHNGIALGAWGAVQATAAGLAIALGGGLRDLIAALAEGGALGPALTGPTTGYTVVYQLEILLLFATLAAIGPLVRHDRAPVSATDSSQFGLAEFPN